MRHALIATALLVLALPAFAADTALTTTAERSGFRQTGRYDEVIALCDGFAPDSLALALVHAEAMGVQDEIERGAAVRQARIARALAASWSVLGAPPVVAEIAGAAHAAAVMIAIEGWARSGPGRSSLPDELARALGVAAATLPSLAGASAGLD